MQDDYNVSRYIPKKYHNYIKSIEMEPDFDYGKNRTVYFYQVFFKDGNRVSADGIKNIVAKVKKFIERKD